MSTLQPAGERGGEQRADAGEGHLAERELARPAGEHGEREGADREARGSSCRAGAARAAVTTSGRIATASTSTSRAPMRSIWRTHQTSRSRSGIGADLRREREGLRLRRARLPALDSTPRSSTATRSRKSMRPGWSRKLKLTSAWTTPMAIPATKARGNDTMPAITAAASARTRVLGPRVCEVSAPTPACAGEQDQRERGERSRRSPRPRWRRSSG